MNRELIIKGDIKVASTYMRRLYYKGIAGNRAFQHIPDYRAVLEGFLFFVKQRGIV